MSFPVNVAIIIAGFYIAIRVSPRGAFFTGLGLGMVLGLLESLAPANPELGVITIFASRILGAVPTYMLINRFDGVLAFLVIVPLGFLLLLAGGPIELVLILFES